MGNSYGQGAGMTQGLPPLRDRNEVCVSSEGIWAILGQCLRCKDSMPKVGDLSLPLIPTLFFQKMEELLAVVGGQ